MAAEEPQNTPEPGRALVRQNTGGISFAAQEFAFGQRVGLTTSTTETAVIQKAIDALCQVPGDLTTILSTLFGAPTVPAAPFGYDPSVDWLVGISIQYSVVTFDLLL